MFGQRNPAFTVTLDIFPGASDPNNAGQNALDLYKEKQEAFIKQFGMLSAKDAGTTPWLERTQFPHYLDGLTTKEIIAFLADDQDSDTEMQSCARLFM